MSHPNPHPAEVLAVLARKGPGTRIAVVGASDTPGSIGQILCSNLRDGGFKGPVFYVNPHHASIAGLPAYTSLAVAPKPIDIVTMVTPPPVTLAVLKEVAALGLPAVWLQDGSFDDAVLAYVHEAPFKTVYDACIMVVSNA